MTQDKVLLAADGFSLTKSLDISQGEYRIALDTDEAIDNIHEKGFYVQGANIAKNQLY